MVLIKASGPDAQTLVGYEKHFGSLQDDRCTGSWHLGNFASLEFSAIELGLQFYRDVQRNTLFTVCKKCRSQCCKSAKFYFENNVHTCTLHKESKQHTKVTYNQRISTKKLGGDDDMMM